MKGLEKKAERRAQSWERTRDAIRNSGKVTEKQAAANRRFLRACGTVMYVVAAGWAVVAIACMSFDPALGWIWLIPGAVCFFLGHAWRKATKRK